MDNRKPKILTAHQPVYLPWLGLFHKISLADQYVIFDTVQYLKRDWNNRNKIKTAQEPQWLTVPVYTHHKFDQILAEVKINNDLDWRKKHLRSLEVNYCKTPYFKCYIDFFRELYGKKWEYLVDLNDEVLRYFLNILGIDVEILYGHDLGLEGEKSDLVTDMCKKLKADIYVFGALGRNYAKVEEFRSHGIEPMFQEYVHPVYPQMFGSFEPFLSVIDLLFNCGDASSEIIKRGNLTQEELVRLVEATKN